MVLGEYWLRLIRFHYKVAAGEKEIGVRMEESVDGRMFGLRKRDNTDYN